MCSRDCSIYWRFDGKQNKDSCPPRVFILVVTWLILLSTCYVVGTVQSALYALTHITWSLQLPCEAETMSICPYEGDWSWRRCSSCWRCFPMREKEQDPESLFYFLSSLAVLHTAISWLETSEHRTLEIVCKCQPVWPTQTGNCGEWIWGPVGPRLAQGSCVGWAC